MGRRPFRSQNVSPVSVRERNELLPPKTRDCLETPFGAATSWAARSSGFRESTGDSTTGRFPRDGISSQSGPEGSSSGLSLAIKRGYHTASHVAVRVVHRVLQDIFLKMKFRLVSILRVLVLGVGLLAGLPQVGTGQTGMAQTASVQEQFEKGNEAYRQGEYEAAVEAYRAVLDDGRTSVALYHNLGNAYYRLGQTGRAIQYYEKARRLAPTNPSIRHNLERARQDVPEAPPTAIATRWQQLVDTVSPLALYVVALLLLTTGTTLAAARADGIRDAMRDGVGGAVVGVGLVTGGLALGTSYLQQAQPQGVVLPERAPVYATPSPSAPADTTLREGQLVTLSGKESGQDATGASAGTTWTAVQLPDGSTGWMTRDAVGRIQ